MRTIRAGRSLFPATRPFHVASRRLARRERCEEHTHAGFAECVLVTAGRLLHQVNGRTLVQPVGTLTLIREHDTHFLAAGNAPAEWINLAFPLRGLRASGLWDPSRRDPVGRLFAAASPPVVELPAAERATVERALRNLLAQADQPWGRLGFHRCLCGLLADYLAPALADGGVPADPAAPALPEWLARELAALERGDAPLPDTRELARRCARVPEHVTRTFRRCLGVAPSHYLNRMRLARAAGLLVNGNAKILEVCRLAGFRNLAHFYRLFREEHGLSPRAYRRRFAVRPPV